tara:strand:+ start:962 stop:1324 length:363 start_codon:yes stop_codon:yes gene_type:complete
MANEMMSSIRSIIDPIVISKKDNKRIEAQRLINKWHGIDVNNIDKHINQIKSLHAVTTRMIDNLEYVNERKSYLIPYISGKYSNINDVIDCYNDYIDVNPLLQFKYNKLAQIDLTGVGML